MRIVCLDGHTLNPGDNPWDDVQELGDFNVYDRTPDESILERAIGAEVILTNKTPLTRATLSQLPDLKFVSVLATGYNVVDVASARKLGITVSNVPVYGTDSVAQFVFALILQHCHHVSQHSTYVNEGRWTGSDDFCFWDTPLIELAGLTMGIVGFGRIGQRVGEIARAFGMEILACDTYQKAPPSYPFCWGSLDDIFCKSDVISLHCPQTEENTGFVNASLLNRMKPTAFLVNTARGGLVNEKDLAEALNSGKIAEAAADVVSAEPIQAGNVLLEAKNMTLTPHIAWATLSARRRLMHTTAENIAAYKNTRPINVVN